MSPLDYAIISMAVWRIDHLFTGDEVGPWDIILNTKLWAEKYSKFLNGLLSCPYCFSIWATPVIYGAYLTDIGRVIVICLSLSGSAIMLEEIRRRIDN
jgi:hypothetical protein